MALAAATSWETLHGLAKRHGVSRNLIRIWVKKLEAGSIPGWEHYQTGLNFPLIRSPRGCNSSFGAFLAQEVLPALDARGKIAAGNLANPISLEFVYANT
jgi:hypothetical protein